MSSFQSVRWGTLQVGQVPNSVFPFGRPGLSGKALKVLVNLIHAYRYAPQRDKQSDEAVVLVRQCPDPKKTPAGTSLTERTGLCRKDVTRAVSELERARCIQRIENLDREERSKKGHLLCNAYVLRNPATGNPLKACEQGSVLYGNGVSYFTFPKVLLTQPEKHWSFASLSSSETEVYVAALYLANKHRQNVFSCTVGELADCSGMGKQTMNCALNRLVHQRGLLFTADTNNNPKSVKRSDQLTIEVCDPLTGEPLVEMDGDDESDPQRYVIKDSTARKSRVDLNICPNDTLALEQRVRSWGYTGPAVHQSNGDLQVCCPLHDDQNPSLSISPGKKGCWHCFGCKKSGSFFNLLQSFKTTAGSMVEVLRSDVEATYLYKDVSGRLRKRVERLPNKTFRQSVPAKGGWHYSAVGAGNMLYNAHLLPYADTIVVCEGEKDCDAVTALQLTGICTPIVAVTSGGADSWDPELAKQLKGKQVIIVPDDDVSGTHYADNVEKSLIAEGIHYKRISFAGTGCKDSADYIERNGKEKFEELIDANWVRLEDGSWIIQEPALIMGLGADAMGAELSF